jgi:hypothetical protein
MERAAALLAACDTWQLACGIDEDDLGEPESVAAARAHVWLGEFDQSAMDAEERLAARPVALVYAGVSSASSRVASPNTWADSGGLAMVISALPAGDDRGENYVSFTNFLGDLISEMRALSGTAGYLNVTAIERIAGPTRPEAEAVAAGEMDELQAKLELTWQDA